MEAFYFVNHAPQNVEKIGSTFSPYKKYHESEIIYAGVLSCGREIGNIW